MERSSRNVETAVLTGVGSFLSRLAEVRNPSWLATLVAFLCLLSTSGISQSPATNYFRWGVESNTFTACCTLGSFTMLSYFSGTSRSTDTAHTGSYSLKLQVIGNDGGNQAMGAEMPRSNVFAFNIVGGPAIYYRWWMKIMPNFSWGSGSAKTKSSRVLGLTYPRVYTGYVQANGFNIGECDDVGAGQPGGGCVDPGPFILYNMRTKNDGQWHEYVVM